MPQTDPVPDKLFIAAFPTPSGGDKYLYRRVQVFGAGYVFPEYGDPVPEKDRTQWPDHRLVLIAPDKENGDGWALLIYAKDRGPQDGYNFSVSYPTGSNAFPQIERFYILDGKTYDEAGPQAMGTADPGLLDDGSVQFPDAVQVLPDQQQSGTGDPIIDSLYVLVKRTFMHVPNLGDAEDLTAAKLFGYKVDYPYEDSSYPRVTWTIPNTSETALASGTACPIAGYTSCKLTGQTYVRDKGGSIIGLTRVFETLPGPQIPFTRYDVFLGPIQGRRKAVINTGQAASQTATVKITYEARGDSDYVAWELTETNSDGTGGVGNPAYPIRTEYLKDEDRGSYTRTTQIVATGAAASLVMSSGNTVATWTEYKAYDQNPLLFLKTVEVWSVPGPLRKLTPKYDPQTGQSVSTSQLVYNSGQTGTRIATKDTQYRPSKWDIQLIFELIDDWPTDMPDIPQKDWQDERGAIAVTQERVVKASQVASLTISGSTVTQITYKPIDEFEFNQVTEVWTVPGPIFSGVQDDTQLGIPVRYTRRLTDAALTPTTDAALLAELLALPVGSTLEYKPLNSVIHQKITTTIPIPSYSLTSGATTSGSANITVASTTGLYAGLGITGTGIPAGATVLSITNATVFVLSANATATNTGLTLTAGYRSNTQIKIDYPYADNVSYPRITETSVVDVATCLPLARGTAHLTTYTTAVLTSDELRPVSGAFTDVNYGLRVRVYETIPALTDTAAKTFGYVVEYPYGLNAYPRVTWKVPCNAETAATPLSETCPILGYSTAAFGTGSQSLVLIGQTYQRVNGQIVSAERIYEANPGPTIVESDFEPRTSTGIRVTKQIVAQAGIPATPALLTAEMVAAGIGVAIEYKPIGMDGLRSIKIISATDAAAINWVAGNANDRVYYGTRDHRFFDELIAAGWYYEWAAVGGSFAFDVALYAKIKEGYSGPCVCRITERYTTDPAAAAFVAALPAITAFRPEAVAIPTVWAYAGTNLFAHARTFTIPATLHGTISLGADHGTAPSGTSISGTSYSSIAPTSITTVTSGSYYLAAIVPEKWNYGYYLFRFIEVKAP